MNVQLKPTNISQIRHLSPFRYPGGKTWLVPRVREWLQSLHGRPSVFVEPFCGGASVGLTVAAEGLADRVFLSEKDSEIASVWKAIFDLDDDRFASFVGWIVHSVDMRYAIMPSWSRKIESRAIHALVRNRFRRGGIMAPGAGLMNAGDNERGAACRWYPETLRTRIEFLRGLRDRVTFKQDPAFLVIQRFADNPAAAFFIDPPYTAGGKKAGRRLYKYNDVDHERLFEAISSVAGSVMLTYDDAPEVRELAQRHGFQVEAAPMKSTHHAVMSELLVLKP